MGPLAMLDPRPGRPPAEDRVNARAGMLPLRPGWQRPTMLQEPALAEMPITTTYVSTPGMVLRAYRACSRRGYRTRLILTSLLVAVGVGMAATGQLVQGILLAGWGAVVYLLAERSVRRQLAPYLTGAREVTVTMTDTEYRTQGPDRATSRTWTTFRSVSRVGDFWVLRVSPQAAMGLPVAALDDDQTAGFIELLRRKGLY